jgi:hypothetical protein
MNLPSSLSSAARHHLARMDGTFGQANFVCLAGLLVPPVFMSLDAYEIGFAASAILATYWLGIVVEAWMDFGRPSPWLLLSGSVLLFWPSYLLVSLSACWVGVGCS